MLATTISITIIATLAMISPGPDFFLVVKNAARYPQKAAMMTGAGVIAGIMTHMLYCVTGLAVVIATTPVLFNVLKYAGAAYLIWIGVQALLARGDGKVNFSHEAKENISLKKAFVQGYLCNLLNPKATLFFLSVFTQVLDINSSLGDKLWYAFIIVILAVIWWPILILIIQSPAAQRALSKAQNVIDKVLGAFLVALGVKVAFL
jgi:RhtB (resistance to homoserine/threonine) family protein